MLACARNLQISVLIGICVCNSASAAPAERVWKSADGKFSTRATYVAVKDSSVFLMKQDGLLINVPFAKLSRQDNSYIATLIQQESKEILKQKEAAPQRAKPNAQANQQPKKQPTRKIKVVLGEDNDLKARNEEDLENKRVAELRKEQLDVDGRATALNTKLGELRSRGRELQVNGQLLMQEIMAHEGEISRRNADIYDARAAGNVDVVESHTLQITLLKHRLAEMRQKHAAMVAEYDGLEQQVYGIESQLSALQDTYNGIADEIGHQDPVPQP